jgi:hypothetical protein
MMVRKIPECIEIPGCLLLTAIIGFAFRKLFANHFLHLVFLFCLSEAWIPAQRSYSIYMWWVRENQPSKLEYIKYLCLFSYCGLDIAMPTRPWNWRLFQLNERTSDFEFGIKEWTMKARPLSLFIRSIYIWRNTIAVFTFAGKSFNSKQAYHHNLMQ